MERMMSDGPDPANNQPPGYVPPKVWTWEPGNGGQFANINRPISGATHEKELPVGKHPIQLYSMGTPNGVKVTIMLEELLAAGHAGAEYDAWLINIGAGDQFGSDFVAINPNSKIPAMMDHSVNPTVRLFESASMLHYLAEKFGGFLPTDTHKRAETMNWVMWQMGSAPYLGGGFGHFYAYAPFKMQYPIDRFTMETKRLLHVLDTHLAKSEYVVGGDYTIADMAIWPWYGSIMREAYNAQEFLSVHEYPNLNRWIDLVGGRDAVKRGRMVNRLFGRPETQLRERHDARDFEVNRQDMVEERGGERV
jgi:GSH-dependent disulfide-bond oxidoreductase